MESISKTKEQSWWKKFTTFEGVSIKGRIIMGFHVLFCWAFLYAQRTNFNIIVAQVVSINPKEKRIFAWTQLEKSTALMSFFAGYWLIQLPGGILGEKYGIKRLMTIGGIISSVLTIVSPFAIAQSAYFAVGVRVLFGIAQSIFPPCFLILMANWYPENCRSTAIGLTFPGSNLGIILAMTITSGLAIKPELWQCSFFIFGGMGILWVICWHIFYTDNAIDNPWTNADERKFISENIQRQPITDIKKFPIKEAFKSAPLICIVFVHSITELSNLIVITLLPSLIADLYYIEVKDQVYITFIAPILTWVGGIVACVIYDFILSKNKMENIKVRKILNIFPLIPPGLFFMFSTLIPPEKYYFGIILLLIACFFSGFDVCISMPNIGDIVPQYSGIVFGFMNGSGTLGGLASIQLSYTIITDTHKPSEWQILFGILIIVQTIGLVLFTVFAQGKVQSWAVQKEEVPSIPLD